MTDWISQQEKTMSRWISSQIGVEIQDLSNDMSDGLVLVALLNQLVDDYKLPPIHSKPINRLQKIENVADCLQFIKFILQLNITNISAENVVDGNLKLILGLVWSLFLYSTQSSLQILNNDCNSFIQIKLFLKNWINIIVKKKSLPEVTNFDRDWSLEINRPDLYMGAILDHYLGPEIKYSQFEMGPKLSNLHNIFEVADTLGIPRLADIDDFVSFVPNEKCVTSYLLEWLKIFELDDKLIDEVSVTEYESKSFKTTNETIEEQNMVHTIAKAIEIERRDSNTSLNACVINDQQSAMKTTPEIENSDTSMDSIITINEQQLNASAGSIITVNECMESKNHDPSPSTGQSIESKPEKIDASIEQVTSTNSIEIENHSEELLTTPTVESRDNYEKELEESNKSISTIDERKCSPKLTTELNTSSDELIDPINNLSISMPNKTIDNEPGNNVNYKPEENKIEFNSSPNNQDVLDNSQDSQLSKENTILPSNVEEIKDNQITPENLEYCDINTSFKQDTTSMTNYSHNSVSSIKSANDANEIPIATSSPRKSKTANHNIPHRIDASKLISILDAQIKTSAYITQKFSPDTIEQYITNSHESFDLVKDALNGDIKENVDTQISSVCKQIVSLQDNLIKFDHLRSTIIVNLESAPDQLNEEMDVSFETLIASLEHFSMWSSMGICLLASEFIESEMYELELDVAAQDNEALAAIQDEFVKLNETLRNLNETYRELDVNGFISELKTHTANIKKRVWSPPNFSKKLDMSITKSNSDFSICYSDNSAISSLFDNAKSSINNVNND